MKKTVFKLGLATLLATNLLVLAQVATDTNAVAFGAEAKKALAQQEIQKIQGKITNISQKAKTIALSQKDDGFFLVKFTDDTELKGVQSTKEFNVDEAIIVSYTTNNGQHIATSLEKALVKLPAGVKETKTDELVKLIADNKDLVVIDARPLIKYEESHIPGSISIPYAKLVKMGDEGAKLLAKYQGKQLVFYCGGNT